jgi:hypothetical protein
MLIITGNLDVLTHAAIVPILAILTASIARRKDGSIFKWLFPATLVKLFAKKEPFALPAFKKCPKCDEQLPISTLVCDTCDYNFLAGTVRHRHKMLPAPADPLPHEASAQTFAYRT